MSLRALLTALLLLSLSPAHAAMFKYNELMIKDYDEMNQLVQAQVAKARAVGSNSSDENVDDVQALAHLREALKLIYSRPNSDNMIAKLTPDVRRELVGYNAYEKTIASLVDEALGVAKNDKAAPSQQATSIFMLENILSEIRPEAAGNPELKKAVEKVKSAKTEISHTVANDMKLRGMFSPRNPSELAEEILKGLPAHKKETKKIVKKPKPEED